MSKKAFEEKLEALRGTRDPALLKKALHDRNNFYVSKAAAIIAGLQMADLIPDLLSAFDRFMTDPVKTDPQCWAKNAIAKALKDLEHRDSDVYLRGVEHFQLEPSFGGRNDTAATLRGTCALALISTRLDDIEILTRLCDRLADPEKPVRMDAALAVGQLGRQEGLILLRLKALIGDADPDVLGQCFSALPVDFVARFLDHADDGIQMEAIAALAQSREAEAVEALKAFWDRVLTPEMRRAILTSLGASPRREAAEFLLSVAKEKSGDIAAAAKAALRNSRFRDELAP